MNLLLGYTIVWCDKVENGQARYVSAIVNRKTHS